MGVIFSAYTATASSIKKSLKKRKARKSSEPPQQQPFSSTQAEQPALSGPLINEHSPSVPPPGTAEGFSTGTKSPAGGQTRSVGVGVVAATSATPESSTSVTAGATSSAGEAAVEDRGKGKMASDEDYASFLDKANQDPNEGVVKSQGTGKLEFKATDDGAKIPPALKKATADAFYVSDADEPFVPVSLGLSAGGKGLPDEAAFAKLVGHPGPKEASVDILDIAEWDTQGEYKDLVDAVREVTKGSDVRVYKIGKDGTRSEYWVVGVVDGRLVGAKALAVES